MKVSDMPVLATVGLAAILTASCSGPAYPHPWCSAAIGAHTSAYAIAHGAPASLEHAVAIGLWWAAHGQSVINEQPTFQTVQTATRKAEAKTKAGLAAENQLQHLCGMK